MSLSTCKMKPVLYVRNSFSKGTPIVYMESVEHFLIKFVYIVFLYPFRDTSNSYTDIKPVHIMHIMDIFLELKNFN